MTTRLEVARGLHHRRQDGEEKKKKYFKYAKV